MKSFDDWYADSEHYYKYDACRDAWDAGAQSRQSEVDELKKRIDDLEKMEFKLAKVNAIIENYIDTKLIESVVVKKLIDFLIKGNQS